MKGVFNMFGKYETWKIVYYPIVLNNGSRGVALIEAVDRQHAINQFMQQYSGQFHTIDTVEKL
ncbi:MAG: hypothetical protein IJ999_02325 [Clostridia bacterium]|nr:hypothetical protein [Clostridia bacterium]